MIDDAEVVWAHNLTLDKNKKLFDYFPNRKKWLLLPDKQPPVFVPYPMIK